MSEDVQPLAFIEHHPPSDFNQFLLFDVWSSLSYDHLPSIASEKIAVTGPGGGIFTTQGDLARPHVRLEHWQRLPNDGQRESDVFEGQLTCETGKLLLGGIPGSPDDIAIDIDPGRYAIRAWRSRIQREYQLDSDIFEAEDNPGYFSEHWLIRLAKIE
ncbi:hypothetical protein [Actinokineospora sp. NBRC 105648]|uniref:hypothetical protein n=1 Tax=Actinokineospora sp. NBRC 105648 TaxID=3032206 RepID=UPI0024A20B4D|nr:hypothetical protein [Actinokineospora sp. NBRC 105648]GLZ38749.1 hypothetical protein Acsp05_23730 [Actinokineospora sp. NBRC 105648]